jgi:predicted AAA+ superfamily ATPase
MADLIKLSQACEPRQSVFDKSRKDVVLYLGDLLNGRLSEENAESFFRENFITKGMRSLVDRVFDRISGKKDQASTFLLSQAMGGGKTHSMLALGLLAKYPKIREQFWPDHDLGTDSVRVVGFDGRESDYKYGVWGSIAEQLGKKEIFDDLYQPLRAPGATSWINLLKGEPTIILLDEMPPYFMNAKSVQIGNGDLAEITTTALSNLMVAANKEELQNVVIVISDLSATAYTTDGKAAGVSAALDNLAQETNRSAMVIEPVATVGDEVFNILRTRLFESMPDITVIDNVAVAYAEEVRKARDMELTAESPDTFANELRESYPFHFSLRNLYGRFKENPSFQQTRGLLRLMRTIVSRMWEQGKAEQRYLIHPYDIDLNDSDIFSEFERINQSLSEAIRADIANDGNSHAEEMDQQLQSTDASDAAKLLYVASLSVSTNPILGLRDREAIGWMCAPGRDVQHLIKDVLEVLPSRA